jgi:hypothetical protein
VTPGVLWLPGPVAVVPAPKVTAQLARDNPGGTVTAWSVVDEISRLATGGGLAARVEAGGRDNCLVAYTTRHRCVLYRTPHGDAYRLGHLSSKGFKDHERLTEASLLIGCTAGWHCFPEIRDLPRGAAQLSSYWDQITRAWATLNRQEPVTRLPTKHERYLDLLTEVVEATRDIEIEQQRSERPVPYRRKASTREERHSSNSVYAFGLLRHGIINEGSRVFLTDAPDHRGRVVRVADGQATVRFDMPIDYRQIPEQGALQLLPSDRVHRAQLDAIEVLRDGRALNPDLLANLVDRHLGSYQPDTRAVPREPLDRGQLDAFRRALTVTDQLLVLGPPGTGKTRTITEIAGACVARGERVLVTSHTNRAVDNVLERLPEGLEAVRIGNEDAMTATARTFLVDAKVDTLRQQILSATDPTASRLVGFTGDAPALRWHEQLHAQLAAAQQADHDIGTHAAARKAAIERVNRPLAARLDATDTALLNARQRIEQTERALLATRGRSAAATARATGPLAFAHRWTARRLDRRAQRQDQALIDTRTAFDQASATHAALRAEADAAAAHDPEVARTMAAHDTSLAQRRDALVEIERAAAMVRAAVEPIVPVPGDTPTNLDGWEHHSQLLAQAVQAAQRRATLLNDWRAQVGEASEELHREVVRYADVVAATCIGSATAPLLAEMDFDLAIVDEAGQISTPTLLVPLVRARRAVLVGDHHQLPPFLDDEVDGWARNLERSDNGDLQRAKQIGELLRTSAFERLYLDAGTEHRVMLSVQRRMPEPLADFVSRAFYDGQLHTDHPGTTPGPVFEHPFALVDTSDQPAKRRREQQTRRDEHWGRPGYVNRLEADLITAIVTTHTSLFRDWAVIVPYRAQAEMVTDLLTDALGEGVADNVGTVDSFQGGRARPHRLRLHP